jgi:hypothetical protein
MTDKTNAERQRRYIARLKAQAKAGVSNASDAKLAQAKARIAELEADLERERARCKSFEAALRQQRAASPSKPAPKPAKPPLSPDEQRERRIKALTTQVRNLKIELRNVVDAKSFFTKQQPGRMPFSTYAMLTTCLHPDKPTPTKDQRAEAFGLLSQWRQASERVAKDKPT